MTQIENGMLFGTDPQDSPMPYRCSECGDGCSHVTEFRSGEKICDDCKPHYLDANGGDFVEDYIDRHEPEYFKTWWFDNLELSEKMSIIKAEYYQQESLESRLGVSDEYRLAADRAEFCAESDGFQRYVELRLT